MTRITFAMFLCAVAIAPLPAQNYQVNWSVVDIGGGEMSSTNYQSASSVGQTAAGIISGTAYQAFIGFWQIDTAEVGISDELSWNVTDPLITRLYAPYPNPCLTGRSPLVNYSIDREQHVSIGLFDLAGRNVTTIVNTSHKPGRYSARISARSSRLTSGLSAGVYFVKMVAGDYRSTAKLVLQ